MGFGGLFCFLLKEGVLKKSTKNGISFSGGKDSTALLLRMLEEKMPVDVILFCDTGLEFPQMYEHLDKVEQYTGRAITRLKPPHSFEYFFYEYSPERKNPALSKYRGFSWPGPKQRWCTGRLKQRVIGAYLKELKQEYHIAQYVGIAADEAHRVREYHYPLVDWGMTEADCLRYCRERGFDWGGLYDVFRRVSCWCCPLQPLSGLRKLYALFPELWKKLRAMDDHTWRQFRADYSVRQLELRFQFEQQCQQAGISLTSREFFRLLKEHLQKQEGVGAPSTV